MRVVLLITWLSLLSLAIPATGAASETLVYGPVQSGENLYRIALKHRMAAMSVTQLMTIIFELNPGAFEQGNINNLKVGSMLRIPAGTADSKPGRTGVGPATTERASQQGSRATTGVAGRGELETLATTPGGPDSDPMPDTGIADGLAGTGAGTGDAGTEALQAAPAELPEPRIKPALAQRAPRKSIFRYAYDVGMVADDNVRLAQNDEDIRDDVILTGTVKATAGMSLDSFSILNYGGSFTYSKFDTIETLDHYEFEVNARYRFALDPGFGAPIYSLRASLGGIEFDSEMRDSTVLSLSAEMNKWLTTTLNTTLGIGFKARESVSEVYDLDEARLFANLDITFTDTDLVYTTLTYIQGDTASSATPSLGIVNASDAIEPDDAFGGFGANQFAYRLDSETWVLTLGYNRTLTQDLSLDLSARFVESESRDDDDIYYERTILRASLLGRF